MLVRVLIIKQMLSHSRNNDDNTTILTCSERLQHHGGTDGGTDCNITVEQTVYTHIFRNNMVGAAGDDTGKKKPSGPTRASVSLVHDGL